VGSNNPEDVVVGNTVFNNNVQRYVRLNWNDNEETLRRDFLDEIEDLSFDAILIGPFGFPYMSNPRLVMSLLMRALKLEGMIAVTLGQEKALFDLRVVSLWQDVESGDVARALAVSYLHYAGFDRINEYHDGNGLLSSVMVRAFKDRSSFSSSSSSSSSTYDDEDEKEKPFKSMQESLIDEYTQTKEELSKIQQDVFRGMVDILKKRQDSEVEEAMRKYARMTPQEREHALNDLERRREGMKKKEEIMRMMEERVESLRKASMASMDRSRGEL